ncbi:MAG: hypothetical protein AAF633_25775, partial [Chloroflexota bacterium]
MHRYFENGLFILVAIAAPFFLVSAFFFAYAPNRVQKHHIHAVQLEEGLFIHGSQINCERL